MIFMDVLDVSKIDYSERKIDYNGLFIMTKSIIQ